MRGRFGRNKRWNDWWVFDRSWLCAFSIADYDYLGVGAVTLLAENRFREWLSPSPMALSCLLGAYETDPARFRGTLLTLDFEQHADALRLRGEARGIHGYVTADLRVRLPMAYTPLRAAVPFGHGRQHYLASYTAVPVTGRVRWGAHEHLFGDGAFACLDFGRGVWPYRTQWYWACGAGYSAAGEVLGLNLGGLWTDGSGRTENAVSLDGRLYPLASTMRFSHTPDAPSQPWRVRADDDSVDLTFEPHHGRANDRQLVLAHTRLEQAFGVFHGVLRVPGQAPLEVRNLNGWCEWQRARW